MTPHSKLKWLFSELNLFNSENDFSAKRCLSLIRESGSRESWIGGIVEREGIEIAKVCNSSLVSKQESTSAFSARTQLSFPHPPSLYISESWGFVLYIFNHFIIKYRAVPAQCRDSWSFKQVQGCSSLCQCGKRRRHSVRRKHALLAAGVSTSSCRSHDQQPQTV